MKEVASRHRRRSQGLPEPAGGDDWRDCRRHLPAHVLFKGLPTSLGFVLGAVCSLAAGFIGMRVAVLANVRTAFAAQHSRHCRACAWRSTAARSRACSSSGLALLSVGLFYKLALHFADNNEQVAISSLIGLALGASLISVFARLGGGIYTKAADVGADLVGKIESHLDEDDPRNPATIADNVGDNVGDCAGMAADVFETYAVSLIGAILIGVLTLPGVHAAVVYPFLLGGVSIIGAALGVLLVNKKKGSPGRLLLEAVGVNSALSAVLYLPITYALFPHPVTVSRLHLFVGRSLPRFHRRLRPDRRGGAHHELLHLHRVLARPQDRPGERDGTRDQHHRGSGHRAARHRVAGHLHRHRHLHQLSRQAACTASPSR